MKRAIANAISASVSEAASPKRTKSDRSLPACCSIKTEELFQDNFGEAFSIEKKAKLVLTEPLFRWFTGQNQKKLGSISLHLIINALVPVMELSKCLIVEVSQQQENALTKDEIEEVAIRIAQESRENSLNELNRTKEDTTSGMLDTTNATDVRNFIMYVEEIIRSCKFPNQGRVELIIHDTTKPKDADKVVVVEAKPSVTPDDREGFFQTCAYMALTRVKYGIHTSHKEAWEFIHLEELHGKADGSVETAKYSISHSQIFDLMKSSYKEFDEQAVDVYAYLLEIYGVPASTDLVASYAATVTATAARGDLLVARLK
eukprot:gene38411-50432_t